MSIKAGHTVEKIGGSPMSDYRAVRDNVILPPHRRQRPYGRIFVVSAYGGVTNLLLDHKQTGEPGVYALFAHADAADAWRDALDLVRGRMRAINQTLFHDPALLERSLDFVGERLDDAARCLNDLSNLCAHGHFELDAHLQTVREMLASLGEAHSAWNLATLLQAEGVRARFIDLSGWRSEQHLPLDERIREGLRGVELDRELPIVTGYAHCREGLMASFDRGYSEMTFSRIAVLTEASEAVIHKEYHLSSADPRLVGEDQAVPIGRTNYDVADQLANLGMEAIHPKAAKGLRRSGIPLRVRNSFEPEHQGTLVTNDHISPQPCVEIIAGRRNVFAVECFDPDMSGIMAEHDSAILEQVRRFRAQVVTKDVNANTVTHYLAANMKTVRRIRRELLARFPDAGIQIRKVAIVSAIGSDMRVPGMLARTVRALADSGVEILAVHQSMRLVDMQFIVDESQYEVAVRSLHRCLIEVHEHGEAICAA